MAIQYVPALFGDDLYIRCCRACGWVDPDDTSSPFEAKSPKPTPHRCDGWPILFVESAPNG